VYVLIGSLSDSSQGLEGAGNVHGVSENSVIHKETQGVDNTASQDARLRRSLCYIVDKESCPWSFIDMAIPKKTQVRF
jgi:hypothetical protein